ncbi:MAG TPA: MarR family transcriptional regulator [Solirubrobacteraceae bacterium]|jgi:DNA-binding MarR family transcriptional regulator|nr:MarR family transcriptional regulator [Solirubrobacteraceae bacterium]
MSTQPELLDATVEEQIDFVAGHLLARASLLVRLLVRQVRASDFSRTEGEVLATLSAGPRRITELAELEGLAQPTMTLLIQRLELRGWVKRTRTPHDGRVVIASLTDAGQQAVDGFRDRFQEALRTDLELISSEQLRALLDATEALGRFSEKLQERGR